MSLIRLKETESAIAQSESRLDTITRDIEINRRKLDAEARRLESLREMKLEIERRREAHRGYQRHSIEFV
ncbi:MAG TPA: hypothetical protein VGD05_07240 [Pyrinomonadaceae bacterium]|jgi:hypothetical protein